MVHTKSIDLTSRIGCISSAGSYSLPRRTFEVVIRKESKTNENDPDNFLLQDVVLNYDEDPKHKYCLDFIGSITSDDQISITKTIIAGKPVVSASGKTIIDAPASRQSDLLGAVATRAVDQSRFIIQALVQTIFSGITAAKGSQNLRLAGISGKLNVVFRAEYDPFDARQTALINYSLRDFGYCLVLSGYSFDLQRSSINNYCDNPLSGWKKAPPMIGKIGLAKARAEYNTKIEYPPGGILYRKPLPYKYYLFVKSNRLLNGGWKLQKTKVVALPNIAPILSVGVDRTFFSERRTALLFNAGSLTNVCIFKKSELLEIVKIPLSIAKAIVVLPREIIDLRVTNTQNNTKLVQAEEKLIAQQTQFIAYQNALARGENPPAPNFQTTSFQSGITKPPLPKFDDAFKDNVALEEAPEPFKKFNKLCADLESPDTIAVN